MSLPVAQPSQSRPSARRDGEGGKRPPRGCGSGAARRLAARWIGGKRGGFQILSARDETIPNQYLDANFTREIAAGGTR